MVVYVESDFATNCNFAVHWRGSLSGRCWTASGGFDEMSWRAEWELFVIARYAYAFIRMGGKVVALIVQDTHTFAFGIGNDCFTAQRSIEHHFRRSV